MEEVLVPIAVLGTLALGITTFTRILTEYFIRKKLVDKGLVGEDATQILSKQSAATSKFSSLKWGLIIFFAGTGIILSEILAYDWERSAMPYGILTMCVSLGFLIYYMIVKDKMD
ncbi:MAG: hypothetical protein JXR03_21425 [Cyclobacteriaceae bacterium]